MSNISPTDAFSKESRTCARTLVVQRILPPYRLPFFRRLAASSELDVVFAYGDAKEGSALRSVQDPPGLETVRLRNLSLGPREILVWQRGLAGLLRRQRFDAVIAEFNPRILSNLAARGLARSSATPFLWWGQGFGHSASGLVESLRLRLARGADAVILYSRAQADAFESRGVSGDGIFVAPNALDLDAIGARAEEWDRAERHRVLCVGRLVPEKKVEILLRAFALAREGLPDGTVLTIVGEGPREESLRRTARELGVASRVEFHGAIYEEERLAPIFNTSWIVVSPGGAGLGIVHSLAYGVPVLLARGEPHGPEFEVLEEGVDAFLFPADDLSALARELTRLGSEPDRLARAAAAGRAKVRERLGLDAMVAAFERAVRSAIAARASERDDRAGG